MISSKQHESIHYVSPNLAGGGGGAWSPLPDKCDSDANPLFYPGYGNGKTNTVYRLREGIERFVITDINNPGATARAQSSLLIMADLISNTGSDTLFNHIPGGCNVLYLDGHVEFLKYEYSGEAPCNYLVANMVGLLAQ